jgi:hypothetical protein
MLNLRNGCQKYHTRNITRSWDKSFCLVQDCGFSKKWSLLNGENPVLHPYYGYTESVSSAPHLSVKPCLISCTAGSGKSRLVYGFLLVLVQPDVGHDNPPDILSSSALVKTTSQIRHLHPLHTSTVCTTQQNEHVPTWMRFCKVS